MHVLDPKVKPSTPANQTSSTGEQCLLSPSSGVLTGSPVSPPAGLPSLFTVPPVLLYLGHAARSPSRRGKTKFLSPQPKELGFSRRKEPPTAVIAFGERRLFSPRTVLGHWTCRRASAGGHCWWVCRDEKHCMMGEHLDRGSEDVGCGHTCGHCHSPSVPWTNCSHFRPPLPRSWVWSKNSLHDLQGIVCWSEILDIYISIPKINKWNVSWIYLVYVVRSQEYSRMSMNH